MSLRFLDGVLPPRISAAATVVAIAALIVACAANAPAATSGSELAIAATASASPEPSAAATPSPAASEGAAPCLPADMFAAVEDISNIVEPSVPAEEIADAVEALDLTGFDDDNVQGFQDDLVTRLRDGDWHSFDSQMAAGYLLQAANLTAC